MMRPVSRLREKKVVYKKPLIFSFARKKTKIRLLGKKTMISVDSAAKLVFEKHKKNWKVDGRRPEVPEKASKELGRKLIQIYGEVKLGLNKKEMKYVQQGVQKAIRGTLKSPKKEHELKKILEFVEKVSKLANKQARKGGIAEEYARSILTNYQRKVDWKDTHGRGRHTENYQISKTLLYRIVKYSAYEAARILNDAELAIKMQIKNIELKLK